MRPPASRGELQRRLGLWDAVAIYAGIILGSGIFWVPAQVAAASPGALSSVVLWAFGAVVAACGAFCYAECSGRLPHTGGFYVFYREVYGEAVAFIGGWAATLVTYPASVAVIALIFAQYLDELCGGLPVAPAITAALAITLAGVLNAFGVRTGANVQRALTAIKLAAVTLLCAAALVVFEPQATHDAPAIWSLSAEPALVLAALVGLLWTYDGWSDVTLVAGEMRDPGRNIGRAVLIGTGLLAAVYILVQLAVQALLPAQQAAASGRVVADAVERGLGGDTGRIVAALIVISTLGSINGIVLTASRVSFAMARDRTFFGWFGGLNRQGTPLHSVAAFTAVSVVYVCSGSLRGLLTMFSFAVWIFYGLTAVALIRLRRRGVGEPVSWRAPGGWTAPAVVLFTAVAMTTGLAVTQPATALGSMGLLATGLPIYGLWRVLRRSSSRGAQGGPSV